MELFEAFGIQPILLAAQVVNFGVLLFLLHRLFYRPILRVLEERRLRIKESMRRAEEIEKRLRFIKEEEARILDRAQKQTIAIINDAKNAAEKIQEKALHDARQQTEAMLRSTRTQIVQEQKAMLEQAKSDIAGLVIAMTKSVLRQTLTPQDQKRITTRAIKHVRGHA